MADPVGEREWLAAVEAASGASDLVQRVELVELFKRATTEEPMSMRLWIAYCEYVWSLYELSQSEDSGLSEEEQLLSQEMFGLEDALNVWQQGAESTKFRINDSHELWNKWIAIELHLLSNSPEKTSIERVRSLFEDRLRVPHSAWDETSQLFSTFITKYDEASWEETMIRTTQAAKHAKELCSQREDHELSLVRGAEAGPEAEWEAYRTYLDWEAIQSRKKGGSRELLIALYERALLKFGLTLPDLWEEYYANIDALNALPPPKNNEPGAISELPNTLVVAQRASSHCPWSGAVWALYLRRAEIEGATYTQMEELRTSAMKSGLDRDGNMESVLQLFAAWCGYLRRLPLSDNAQEEDAVLSVEGFPKALKSAQQWGEKLVGKKNYKGDPTYRLERLYIQHLTDRGLVDDARAEWKKLTKVYGDSWEFWQRYYVWEMLTAASNDDQEDYSMATAVLKLGINRRTLDWPEKIIEILLEHAELRESASELQTTTLFAKRISKGLAKRREKEAAEAAAIYVEQLQLQPQVHDENATTEPMVAGQTPAKRKHEDGDAESSASKKQKGDEIMSDAPVEDASAAQSQHLKRDRENTTIIVSNLPAEVTQTKVRQFFREYGHINNLTIKTEADKASATALIEFRSTDDVKSALIRDGKYFGENQIKVAKGTGLTLYVTNYPPTADEEYMRNLFKDCGDIFSIRWPSLKFNTHRRFCYISFRTAEAAAAATKLDGKMIEKRFKLVAKYSDPSSKKPREGAMNEGREVHIANLDRSASEDDVKEVFSKYGTIESVRILKNMAGVSKGSGFVVFTKKEEATAALELDNTKFKSQILKVDLSSATNFKPTATSTFVKATSGSPAPDADGDIRMSPSPDINSMNNHASHAPSRAEIAGRTIAIMNVPDTVNDARLRALASKHGEVTKFVLRPDHQGAIIEYSDVSATGRASLALEGHEIVPGRKLRTGSVKDLFQEKEEYRSDKIVVGAAAKKPAGGFMQPAPPVRRPGPKSGVGVKRGLGFAKAVTTTPTEKTENAKSEEGKAAPKSNADFKAMFLSNGKWTAS